MKIWIAKACIQKLISFLPFSQKINYLFQKYITRGVRLTDALFEDKLQHFTNHYKAFRKYSYLSPAEARILELGTGWFPVIPVAFFLSGFNSIYTVDISSLLRKNNLITTLRKFIDLYKRNQWKTFLYDIDESRVRLLEKLVTQDADIKSILESLGIHALVTDARNLPFRNAYFDLFISNNTFEHIHEKALHAILKEFKRLAVSKSVMSHFIDMSDHFSHLDKSIDAFNFLKFSDAAWSFIDNSVQPQNRLRIYDYRRIYNNTGINIIEEQNRIGEFKKVKLSNLNKRFKNRASEDIKVTHTHLISLM
jgi:hypothetical protein